MQLAKQLQEKYLNEHTGDPDVDPRDIQRMGWDVKYVAKFIRQGRGNLDNAYNIMVGAMKWRKSIGLNDIKFEEIDEELWRSGMAQNHGLDRDGNNITILNIYMHKKDNKKAPMLRKWISFCFETQQRRYPDRKMLMVFDATGAGLAQMDMELLRFIVNCFKIYFPDIISYLLVFNMPWILQAAWKIVQGWLSEGAATRVKFVTTENITEFIPPEVLLKKFGGENSWEYDFDVERAPMMVEMEPVWTEEWYASGLPSDLVDGEGGGGNGGKKQVHFSAGLPPTRQSRYGTDEDEQTSASAAHSPKQRVLAKGTAGASGFRRRQVSKLMSLQSQTSGLPRQRSLGNGELNGGPGTSLRRLSEPINATNNVGDLIVSPSHELVFSGSSDENEIICTLTLTNTANHTAAYKIKTTAPTRYKVRPNLSLIDPKSVAKVHVLLAPGTGDVSVAQDKFLVQSYTFVTPSPVPEPGSLMAVWKALPDSAIAEHRMRCRWLTDEAVSPLPASPMAGGGKSDELRPSLRIPMASPGTAGARPSLSQTSFSSSSSGGSSSSTALLERKVDLLTKNLRRVQRTNYLIVFLLLVVMTLVYAF